MYVCVCAVVANWRKESTEAGVNVLYKHGRKLVGDRTTKSRLSEVRVTESMFADDAALYATSRDSFESATIDFVKTACEWGLTVSIEKTKGMVVGQTLDEHAVSSVQLDGGVINVVDHFTYLGSIISRDGEVTMDVDCRIAKAARAFGCLRRPIFQDKHFFCVHKKTSVPSSCVTSSSLWSRNLDIEGSAREAPKLFPQPLHKNYLRCDEVPTVEGENII